ncbi:MAG: hypothetical protein E6Q98_12285 [Rhodospirillaceae bacterium]|nr:MAG: hypothetical protein E6Q98_12285 [Rhodospirillaceae bacterium]
MWLGQDLISTKYRLPPSPANLVERRRLQSLLNKVAGRKLTTISAPAGFGKTTLLLQWAQRLTQEGSRIAWLSLDADDDEVRRFLCYLIAALQTVDADIGKSALALLRSSPVLPTDSVLAGLINDLEQLDAPLVVMLDDTHWLQSSAVLQALESLLSYAPGHIHFVLAGRGIVPLAAARLKVHGQMIDLHEADLRFDLAETDDFLNRRHELALSPDDLVILQHRTEGWIAGLQLASLSLDRRVERSAFIKSFSGTDRDIADFLANDVFIRQPRALQDFMIRTAFLDRLNADLCAAVAGLSASASASLLEDVERSGLFLIPLDDDARWFRYHHLFAEFLRHQMERRDTIQIPQLHRRAADWYEANGDLMACINHLLAAGASNQAADKVEGCAMALIGQSHVMQLSDWLRKIPYDVAVNRPRLLLVHVWLWFHMNKPVEAARMLRAARRAITALRDTVSAAQYALWQAEMRTLMAGVTSAADRSTRARRIAETWAPQLPDDQPFLHGTLMNIRSYCDYSLGNLDAAKAASAMARRSHVRAESIFGIVYADLLTGLAEKAGGNLRQAAQLFARAQDIAEEALGEGSYAAALVGIFQAELLYEWNDLDEAERLLNRHRDIVEDSALVVHEVVGKLVHARLEAAAGRVDGALAQLDRVERRQAVAIRRTRLSFAILHERVKLLLQRGDTVGARLALQALGLDPDVSSETGKGFCIPTSDFDNLASARLLLAEKQYDRATSLLHDLNTRLAAQGRGRRLMQSRLLLAFCRQQAGDPPGAIEAIAPSLPVMAQQDVIRSVLDEGPAAASLVALLNQDTARQRIASVTGSDHAIVGQYLAKLAASLTPSPVPATTVASRRLGLSERELDVLRLLSDGLSNRDLSRGLSISPDTVKWHLKNIFGKLGVENRAQAILAAQRLRLVETRHQ